MVDQYLISMVLLKSIFIEIKNAKITKIITRFSPEIKLAESAPKIDPKTIPKPHFFTMFKFVFLI